MCIYQDQNYAKNQNQKSNSDFGFILGNVFGHMNLDF